MSSPKTRRARRIIAKRLLEEVVVEPLEEKKEIKITTSTLGRKGAHDVEHSQEEQAGVVFEINAPEKPKQKSQAKKPKKSQKSF